MSAIIPRNDIFEDISFTDQKFALYERQEYSRMASGQTIGKSFGSALWTAQYTTAPMYHDDALELEARLHALDGVIGRFYAGDLRRQYPRMHPKGDFPDTAKIKEIGSNNKSLALSGLAAGLQLSVGDYLSFDYGASKARGLFQVIENAIATNAGKTPVFEVRPHLRPGITVGASVTLKKPTGVFALLPQSIETSIHSGSFTVVTFNSFQML